MNIIIALMIIIIIILIIVAVAILNDSNKTINNIRDYNQINVYVNRGIVDNIDEIKTDLVNVKEEIRNFKELNEKE